MSTPSSSDGSDGLYRTDMESFHAHLARSRRVLALLGAGLSASSGLPTFRGPGGLWRQRDATALATPGAFNREPGLVWHFYNYRRHMALSVQPNPAHYALAELSRRMPGFMALSQNVDGLCQRAGHPPEQLQLLHGTLFELHCENRNCGYKEVNFTDPVVPALAPPTSDNPATNPNGTAQPDIASIEIPIRNISRHELPKCPRCNIKLLRPGVVWFGEALPTDVLNATDRFINDRAGVDLIMVIGTSAKVWPAAGYIEEARGHGARVCVVNLDDQDRPPGGWDEGDWMFKGDAAVLVPQLLQPVIGDVQDVIDRGEAATTNTATTNT